MSQENINKESIIKSIIEETEIKAKKVSENNPLIEILKNPKLSSNFHQRTNTHIYNYLLLDSLKKVEKTYNFKAQEIYNKIKK